MTLEGLRAELDSVLARDPAARNRVEVVLFYSGVHAVWAHRISHRLWGRGRHAPARALSQLARWVTGVEIHPGARIGRRLFIDHGSGVVIGETAEVGDDVTLYHGVTLGGVSTEHVKRHPTVGDRVVVGAGAKILGPVTVGAESRIGANAVVLRSVPDGSVVVGVPGQVIAARRAAGDTRVNGASVSDPVGAAVKSLLSRVDRLEAEVTGHIERQPLHMPALGMWETDDYSI
ncbi:MAG: serine O-acetyltransferase [Frankiaceae bacterium]